MVDPVTANTGHAVLRRQFEHEQLSRVWVGRVASDDERGLLIWIADGSLARDVIAADGRPFHDVPFEEWGRVPKRLDVLRWRGDVLMLHPPGTAYSVWWFFDPGNRFRGWYVNLERPGVRWNSGDLPGIDTVDHDIDITVGPDRSWQWKDEEQFARHLRYDHYWVDDEAAVRAAGAAAIERVTAGVFPFDGTWCDFRSDPAWTAIDVLPPGWDRPRAY